MNKKKKILLTICFILVLIGSLFTYNSLHKPTKQDLKKDTLLAIYIQDETSETGYTLSNDTDFPTDGFILNLEKSSCTNEGTLSQNSSTKKISLSTVANNSCSLYFDKETLTGIDGTLARIGKETKSSEGLNFANAATTDETADGLYSLEDDYGTSYFYRGDITDNYVKFGKWSETSSQTEKRGKNMYWRIIRVNGDGSVRLIYDGTSVHSKGDTDADRVAWSNQKFNALYDDAKYIGYMYGPTNDVEGKTTASTNKDQAQANTVNSDIKTKLEEWYVENLASEDTKITDTLFCYDRTTPGSDATGWSDDTGLGYGTNITAYGAYSRLGVQSVNYENVHPQFTCENKNDAYTVSDTEKGNGALSQKVGLITADEIVAAGSGKYGTGNLSYYLRKGNLYWSGSPYSYHGSGTSCSNVFYVSNTGNLNYGCVYYNRANIAPVISLTPEYFNTLIGDGTIGNEFREAE